MRRKVMILALGKIITIPEPEMITVIVNKKNPVVYRIPLDGNIVPEVPKPRIRRGRR